MTVRRSGVAAGLIFLMHGCAVGDAERIRPVEEYRPAERIQRLEPRLLAGGDDIGLVRDFDMAGDTVYLLDSTGSVAIIRRVDEALNLVGRFGRRGAGPGEFLRPTSLALAGAHIVVADGTRLQVFSRSGEPLTTKWLSPPCVMMSPSVTPAANGLFLHGGCIRAGYVTDTMKAVLAWSADTVTWEVVFETPRFTRDGSLGSVFGASSLLTTGAAGIHAFGGGEQNCIWNVRDDGGVPSVAGICPAAGSLYSADPPPDLANRIRFGTVGGMRIRWPESLPVYMERFVVNDHVVLVRPFAADSVVLQLAAPSSLDIAVAPLDGLIGCKAAGCLWLLEDADRPRLIVLDRVAIEALVARERAQ